MESLRTLILDQIVAELNAPGRPADVPVITSDSFETNRDGPTMRVLFMTDDPERRVNTSFPVSRNSLTVGVECSFYADTPALRQRAVEPMLTWAVAVLGETNLNELALSVEPSRTVWSRRQEDRFYVGAIATYIVTYQNKRNDITTWQ